MADEFGFEGQLFLDGTEIDNICSDVKFDVKRIKIDTWRRRSGDVKTKAPGPMEASVSFDIRADGSAAFTKVLGAFNTKSVVDMTTKSKDGGEDGPCGDMYVTECSKSEAIEGGNVWSVVLEPADSTDNLFTLA